MMVPSYVQDDPTLARVLDEASADKLHEVLAEKTVRDLIPKDRVPLPVVTADDTVLEIAAIMAANRCPLVAVVEKDTETASLLGAISASDLLKNVLPPA